MIPIARPFARIAERLRGVGLRPTRQRLSLGRILFAKGDRHVTAEMLHDEAQADGVRVSLATVYNTLNQFTAAGLLREVAVDTGRSYFDTNTSRHHHFYDHRGRELTDIPAEGLRVQGLPRPPEGLAIDRIDVVVRLKKA
ncbi:MAG: transcriptional repressor [Alphaproteobacteria bacterium]|nr:transcriptional repressor [Alphaproteobacteria bacterium]